MITADGWVSTAIRMEGRPPTGPGFNPGVNPVKGLVFHSAEGWAQTLLSKTSQWGYYNAQYPWQFSNLLDGSLYQHYSLNVRCWHGSAFNDSYAGIEHEGVSPEAGKGPLLTDAQIASDQRLIAEVSAWKGWKPQRPVYSGDKAASLYEHKETVWFGGTSTSCPNNRIPWDKILAPQEAPMSQQDIEELADRRALALVLKEMNWPEYGDGLYRPVSVAEANGQLLIELWNKDRVRPPEPVVSFWVRKP